MNVAVEVVGEGTREVDLADDATYADLIRETGYHPQEASVLVDGSPVPGDRVVDADEVRLLRLIKGGATDGGVRDRTATDDGA
ncbi:ubiquitin-like small modifier protein SAMP2 [Halorubrum depositum]|uniref:ubiquitin-like small modifier protein SAMP2 n=1 Tax=Halorubrum depositum TaxID=2583992 RepID=UPI0011A6AED7|nr:ubiquitin-like small modifier protein 2 [Halorubrum depositum]